MAGTRVQVIGWQARRLLDAVSPLVWATAGLALVEVLFYIGSIVPLAQRQAALLDDALHHRSSKGAVASTRAPPHVLATDMAAFFQALPRKTQAAKMARRLNEIAEDTGIWIDQIDYRPVPDNDGNLVLYQITLPTKGAYPDLRQFLARAIRDIPGLAVEGVTFQRQRVAEAELDAQFKLTLYMSASNK